MKKKKLKKKIKKLEKELQTVIHDSDEAFEAVSENIDDLKRDFEHFQGNFSSTIDGHRFQLNDIYEKLKILKLRTETDYTQFKPLVDTSKGPDDTSRIYP